MAINQGPEIQGDDNDEQQQSDVVDFQSEMPQVQGDVTFVPDEVLEEEIDEAQDAAEDE